MAAGHAAAQMGGGPGGGKGPRPHADTAGGDTGCASGQKGAVPSVFMVQGLVQERLNRLPRELGLQAGAIPAFERYATTVTRLMDDEVKRSLKPPLQQVDAAFAIEQQITDASSRLTAWEEVQQAGKALLSLLNMEQQAIANKRLIVSTDPKNWMDKASL